MKALLLLLFASAAAAQQPPLCPDTLAALAAGKATGVLTLNSATPPCYELGPAAKPAPVIVDGETPAGTIDGLNAVFTLAAVPSPLTSLHLYAGIRLQASVDYTLAVVNGVATITFTANAVPAPGMALLADYRH